MVKFFLKFYIILLISFFQNCTDFTIGHRKSILTKFTKSEKTISYELFGWETNYHKKRANHILRTIHESGKFSKISNFVKSDSDLKIQIILEKSPAWGFLLNESNQPVSALIEKNPKGYSLFLLNRVISGASRLILPVVSNNKEVLTFKVWKSNQKIAEYKYNIESINIFGWVSFFLFPIDEKEDIKVIYSDHTRKFLMEFQKNYDSY